SGVAVDVDSQGNLYLAGQTSSSHDASVSNPPFPVTAGAFDTTFGGGSFDAFVGKVRADGTGLAYLTYVGGSNVDGSQARIRQPRPYGPGGGPRNQRLPGNVYRLHQRVPHRYDRPGSQPKWRR